MTRLAILALQLSATLALSAQEPRLIAVSNEMSRSVMLLDARTGILVATIPPHGPPRGFHVPGDNRRIYVALSDEKPNTATGLDAIAEIDVATKREVSRVPAGTDPEQFALAPGDH